ncbi:MAG: hypothetical protein WDO74_27995 [Pseudomonadota bacterium]
MRDQGGPEPGNAGPSGSDPSSSAADSAGASSSSRGPLPWLTLGAGVVIAGVGGTLYALGAHDHAQVTNSPGYGDPSLVSAMTRAEAQSYVDSGTTKKVVGGIGLGLGGALIATSVVLFVTGKSESRSSAESATLTVAPSANGFYAGYSGRF